MPTEIKTVQASGHLFKIIDGVRHWISEPPNDYMMTDGTKWNTLEERNYD